MNKKITILLFSLLFTKLLLAVPAYPGLVDFVQPDGKTINIYKMGDERVKWAQTSDGYSLLFNENGFYEYAILDDAGDMKTSGYIAHEISERTVSENQFLSTIQKKLSFSKSQVNMLLQIASIYEKEGEKSFPTTGQRKLICILMGYLDKPFTKTKADFEALLNNVGYNVGGATGSVYDYFYEASYQQLELTTTVSGPYTSDYNMAYYGGNDAGTGNDINPDALITEAVQKANDEILFSDFDNDSDGQVDAVYVIYAGVGEEAYGGANAIWAHASSINNLTVDGVIVSKYSCSSEFRNGTNITRIGVICHEFGHVLGARDYYDTDYTGSGGEFIGTGKWDLQAEGSWNGLYGDGATPAHPNAYTICYVYNWATATLLTTNQDVTIVNPTPGTVTFYRYDTKTTNEFFIMENRQKLGFDTYIPGNGLIIYHADRNWINSHGYNINASSHQGMYPVCASVSVNPGTTVSSFGSINTQGCAWPYNTKTSFTDETIPCAKSWAAQTTSKPLTNIAHNTSTRTVTLTFSNNLICTPPTNQATSFSVSNTTNTTITLNWVRGSGDAVLIIARKSGSVNVVPENGTAYTGNSAFGTGTLLGTDNYVIYNGDASTLTLTGLIENKNYYFSIFEYYSTSNCYLTPALTGTGSAITTDIYTIGDNKLNIYPNPSNGVFNIDFTGDNNYNVDIQVFSIDGKMILSNQVEINKNNSTTKIDLSNKKSGVYILKISLDNNILTKYLILK